MGASSLPAISHLQTLVLLQIQECDTLASVVKAINRNPFRDSVTRQTVYQVAKRLTDAGLIKKDRTGSRESNVSLTAKGHRTLNDVLSFCRYVQNAQT